MATNEKIKIIEGSKVLQVTDPTSATFLGYKTVNGEKQTIQVDFSNMTPLFGVSQTVGTSTTLAPSEAAVAAALTAVSNNVTTELGKKADKTVNEKSVVYAMNGDITKETSFLASDTQNGLITPELFKQIQLNKEQLNEYEMAIKDMTPPHMRFNTKVRMTFDNGEDAKYYYAIFRISLTEQPIDNRLMVTNINGNLTRSSFIASGLARTSLDLPKGNVDAELYSSDISAINFTGSVPTSKSTQIASNSSYFTLLNIGLVAGSIDVSKVLYLKYLTWGINATNKLVDCADNKELIEFNGAKNKQFVSFIFDGAKIEKINLQGCSSFSDMLAVSSALKLKEVDLSGTAAIMATLDKLNSIWYNGNNGTLKIDAALHAKLVNENQELYNSFVNKGISIVSVS